MPHLLVVAFSANLLFVTSAIAGSLVFYAHHRPSSREWAIVIAVTGGALWRLGLEGAPMAKVMLTGAYFSCSAFIVTALAPFAAPRQVATRLAVMRLMVLPPLLFFGSAMILSELGPWWAAGTVDDRLYAADATLGIGQPALAIGAWVWSSPALRFLTEFAYANEPLVDVLVYAALLRRSPPAARRLFVTLVVAGLVGASLYFLCPAVGWVVALGDDARFQRPAALTLLQAPESWIPRNCMPSLHTASGLILLWAFPRRTWPFRAVMAYFVLMEVYALACGHYLVDLIAAIPFTVAIVQGVRNRLLHAVTAAGGYALWLAVIRINWPLAINPVVPWSLTVASLLTAWGVRTFSGDEEGRAVRESLAVAQ